jgi:hypothetical protein
MLDTIVQHPNHPPGPPVKRGQGSRSSTGTCTRKRRIHTVSCVVPGPPGSRSYSTRTLCAHVANCVRLPSPVQPQQKTLADHCGAKSASTPKLQGPRPSARPRRSAEYGRDTLPKGSRGVSRLPCDTFAAVQRGCPILKPTQPGTAGTECVLLAGIFLPRTPLDWPGTSHSWRLTCFDSPSDKLN